jgi:hypothetical protein
VAPNYAGYDISTLGYHPFLNASQQSGEMMDALTAASTALPTTFASSTSDNGQLFITGYSEGGYVAMATQRAMETAGLTVTAAAPMSGPYALEALFDAVLFGNVDLGSTLFSPLVTTSYQHAYGNVYNTTSDYYSTTYSTGIDTLLPSTMTTTQIFEDGLLPVSALFDSTTPTVAVPNDPTASDELTAALAVPSNPNSPLTPLFAAGFGNPFLINNSIRVSYALDTSQDPDGTEMGTAALAATPPSYGLRLDLYKNDLWQRSRGTRIGALQRPGHLHRALAGAFGISEVHILRRHRHVPTVYRSRNPLREFLRPRLHACRQCGGWWPDAHRTAAVDRACGNRGTQHGAAALLRTGGLVLSRARAHSLDCDYRRHRSHVSHQLQSAGPSARGDVRFLADALINQ